MSKEQKNKTELIISFNPFGDANNYIVYNEKSVYFSRSSLWERNDAANRIIMNADLSGFVLLLLFILSIPIIYFLSLDNIYIFISLYTFIAYSTFLSPLLKWIFLSLLNKKSSNKILNLNCIEFFEFLFCNMVRDKDSPSWNPFPSWNPPWVIRVLVSFFIALVVSFSIPYIVIDQLYFEINRFEFIWSISVSICVAIAMVSYFILILLSKFSRIKWR